MDLTSYLKYAGSVARTGTLLQAGFSERSIRNALAAGEMQRLRHGVVALAGPEPDLVAAVLANGLLCCASAAPHHGLWQLHAPGRPHLLCRHGMAAGAVIHRGSVVPPEFPRPVAGLTDTLLHALRCLPPVEAAVMVESALLQGRRGDRRQSSAALLRRAMGPRRDAWGGGSPVAHGRKNLLHVGSAKAGPKVAAILSVVESCRRLGIPVKEYLLDVLPGLNGRKLSEIAHLTPARWSVARV